MFSRTPKRSLNLILDVESALVTATLVLSGPDASPQIIFTHSVDIPYRLNGGSAYLIKMALRGVSETVGMALRHISGRSSDPAFPRKVSAVHYVLSSPWIVSQAKVLAFSFPKDTIITDARVRGAIAEERAKLTKGPSDDLSVIEEKVFDVRLNGYSVASWKGKPAREMEVSFVASVAGTAMIDRFREACIHAAPARQVFFHSSLLLQRIGIQELMPERGSYTLIHVHGELTDVAVTDGHSCAFFGSYPIGIQTMIRRVGHAMHLLPAAADSLVALALGEDMAAAAPGSPASSDPKSVVASVAEGWIYEFKKLIYHADMKCPLPTRAIVSSAIHGKLFIEAFFKAYPDTIVDILDKDPHILYVSALKRMEREG